jgi:hypothetical protein
MEPVSPEGIFMLGKFIKAQIEYGGYPALGEPNWFTGAV